MPTDFSAYAYVAHCQKCKREFMMPAEWRDVAAPYYCEKCVAQLSQPKVKSADQDSKPAHQEPGPYAALGAEIGRLVETKQAAYGDSFGKAGDVLRIFYPTGVPPEKFDDMLALVRLIDKQFRIATKRDAFGESPWRDIAGYALLAVKQAEGEGENG